VGRDKIPFLITSVLAKFKFCKWHMYVTGTGLRLYEPGLKRKISQKTMTLNNNNNNNDSNNNNNDIIIRDNEEGTCMLSDVAIPGDRNVIKKDAEKIPKYKDLIIEIQRMWNVKTKVTPVIIGATGTISKSFQNT
jgi:hypothetical protein